MDVGVVFASTGGYKTVRALRSFSRMEPDFKPNVVIDISSKSWNGGGNEYLGHILKLANVKLVENHAHINGTLNRGMEWMAENGHTHVALFHDDIVFSSLLEHQGSFSCWLTPKLLEKSAITFCHLECFKKSTEAWARRHPVEWDAIDLESGMLWTQLAKFKRENAYPIQPEGADWFCHYEGCDKVRKWNRLGPTGQVVPIETWLKVGKFDEVDCVHYDQDYPVKCFRMGLVPNYAVPNIPWLHLHNQSMNPWFDPAPGRWGTMEAMIKKFGADWPGIWGSNWENEWHDQDSVS